MIDDRMRRLMTRHAILLGYIAAVTTVLLVLVITRGGA